METDRLQVRVLVRVQVMSPSGKNFLDLPQQPDPRRRFLSWGFDPGLPQVGWGLIEVIWNRAKTDMRLVNAGLITTTGKAQGLAQTTVMAAAILDWKPKVYSTPEPDGTELVAPYTGRLFDEHFGDRVTIEAQEVYKDGKADANDLLRLAQVTGMLQARTLDLDIGWVEAVIPKDWKQQQDKDAMAAKIRARLQGNWAWMDNYKAKLHEHVFDAIGMAMWRAKRDISRYAIQQATHAAKTAKEQPCK